MSGLTRQAVAGQGNLPEWGELEKALRGILERRYFTNNGPLVRELDATLAAQCGVSDAVCVANEGLAFTILAAALEKPGEALIAGISSSRMRQALTWGGLIPVVCDGSSHDPYGLQLDAIEERISPRTVALVGVHAWGRVCNVAGISRLAELNGVSLIFDATSAFGCTRNGVNIATFGRASVFSLQSSTVVNGADAAFIATNDRRLAKKLRTMRNFYPSETFAVVPLRINGKVSEVQAALALLSMKQLPHNIVRNKSRYAAYDTGIAGTPSVTLLPYDPSDSPNYADLILRVDNLSAGLTPAQIARLLAIENIVCSDPFGELFVRASGTKRAESQPVGTLLDEMMRLPNCQWLDSDDVVKICSSFARILRGTCSSSEEIANVGKKKSKLAGNLCFFQQ